MSTTFRRALSIVAAVLMAASPAFAWRQSTPSGAGGQASASATPQAAQWPKTFTKGGSTVVLYQPQIDAWKDHQTIRFRAAVAVTPSGATEPVYGVVAAQADTAVNSEAGTVVLTNIQPAVQFPGMTPSEAAPLQALVLELVPSRPSIQMTLPQVLAYMHEAPKPTPVPVDLQPPPIFHSDSPAIMVIFLGQPQFKPIEGAGLMFAVNTNWPVLLDTASGRYYLLDGHSWLTAPDPLKGPWTAAAQLPGSFSSLPAQGWEEVRQNVPGQPFTTVPRVFTSTVPSELIVTDGPPEYTPIPGTRLMYVSNPVTPLFMDLANGQVYYLAAGRWFKSLSVDGPWSAASNDLPAEFAKIPPDSPVGFVLASVPGTEEASNAVLLASVPHKATINISEATVQVAYDGPPHFVPIAGTPMSYATNTSYQVVQADGRYYCCYRAVWFVAPAPTGPWTVCTSVPEVIYTIPPTCPLYNVTYVRVYSATPTTVVVGYTGGYSGEYVAATGVLMFGAGIVTGALLADGSWCCCTPCYWSYGCGAWYHGGYGWYCGGGYRYGPWGSAGWGASYNPATGVWSRSGYATGPYGAASFHQAYNPWTNTYAGHASATNGYSSWGRSTVSQGSQWASAGHVTGPGGVTRGAAVDSSGQWAEGVHGPGDSGVARTSGGDVYAGHDGNVYRNQDGQWQKYDNGSWNNVQRPTPPSNVAESRPQDTGGWQSPARDAQGDWRQSWGDQAGGAAASRWGETASQPAASGWQDRWNRSDVQNGLNRDSWARQAGNSGWGGGWANRESSWGGGDGFRGGWGGGGRFGGGFGGFRGGFRR